MCGIGKINAWEDLAAWMTMDWVNRMRQLYASPADVDLYMGGIMENPLPGTDLCPTLCRISSCA
jgi:hypothetical protein